MTSTHGPATRGMRRSRGSRSGLPRRTSAAREAAMTPGLAGAGPLPAAVSASSVISDSAPYPGPDRVEQLVPRRGELGHALVLQHPDHVVVADAEPFQVGEGLPRRVVAAVHGVAVQLAVVGHGPDGALGHGVHRV